ncbi:hypothetical protein QBC33DRAFT_701 [Phialemonium atrogriseum]|uniref:Uncharacterized protein n=1 Tax=Phialemonium atrogriseum TaxID=1093897 RepID=A0AAJ0FL09_9PEZI|nr:uncharacterized protein QBC33DRAFT_701 [Phialemonium atrogriseum]KAK1772166.1 hypothetical protein QBC33DRAFT_701 [Phialemonium atrogriseum]
MLREETMAWLRFLLLALFLFVEYMRLEFCLRFFTQLRTGSSETSVSLCVFCSPLWDGPAFVCHFPPSCLGLIPLAAIFSCWLQPNDEHFEIGRLFASQYSCSCGTRWKIIGLPTANRSVLAMITFTRTRQANVSSTRHPPSGPDQPLHESQARGSPVLGRKLVRNKDIGNKACAYRHHSTARACLLSRVRKTLGEGGYRGA